MSTLTSLLNLIKPEGGDLVNVANFNSNMDTLDAAVLLTASQTLTNKTLTAPTISGPTITGGATIAGGLTISTAGLTVTAGGAVVTAGGLQVTAGNIGVGAAPVSHIGVHLPSTLSITAASGVSVGAGLQPTLVAAANSNTLAAAYVNPTYTVGAFTSLALAGVLINANSAAQATATKYGLFVGAQTGANSSNYGVYIEAPSGGSGANHGLYNAGTSLFVSPILLGASGNAASGSIRMQNNSTVAWRNAAGNADLSLYYDTGDRLVISTSATPLQSSATGGSATALPAAPHGYLRLIIDGSVRKIPVYND
jgi:hypothetical protein